MSDEDEEITEDQLIGFAYQHMRSYFDDLDYERLIKMYIHKNIKDVKKYLKSQTTLNIHEGHSCLETSSEREDPANPRGLHLVDAALLFVKSL